MIEIKQNEDQNIASYQIGSEKDRSCVAVPSRQPYIAPQVSPYKPSIEGSDTVNIEESQGGLWTSS